MARSDGSTRACGPSPEVRPIVYDAQFLMCIVYDVRGQVVWIVYDTQRGVDIVYDRRVLYTMWSG